MTQCMPLIIRSKPPSRLTSSVLTLPLILSSISLSIISDHTYYSSSPSVHQLISPSVHPSVRPPVRPSTCPSVRPSVHPSGSPISPSVHPVVQSVRPSVRQSNQPRTSMLGLSPRASTAARPDRTMSAPSCPGCTFQAAPSVHAAHASSQSRPLDAHVILAHVILALAVLPCLQASAIVRTRMPLRSRASMNS